MINLFSYFTCLALIEKTWKVSWQQLELNYFFIATLIFSDDFLVRNLKKKMRWSLLLSLDLSMQLFTIRANWDNKQGNTIRFFLMLVMYIFLSIKYLLWLLWLYVLLSQSFGIISFLMQKHKAAAAMWQTKNSVFLSYFSCIRPLVTCSWYQKSNSPIL